MTFHHHEYYGSISDEYIEEICVKIEGDPSVFVNGWEGLFISIGVTSISTKVDVQTLYRPYQLLDSYDVYLNATQPRDCFNINYSSIADHMGDMYGTFNLDIHGTNVSRALQIQLELATGGK